MGRINVEIPDNLHEQLKVNAARNDRTLKEQVIHSLADGADVEI